MDLQRISREVSKAIQHFPLIEAHPTDTGGVYVKAGLQTSLGQAYVLSIYLTGYPTEMPKVYVNAPALSESPHKYKNGNLCYMHPNFWNPGRHDLQFVLQQVAVWLNKYDVYRRTGRWPGPGIAH